MISSLPPYESLKHSQWWSKVSSLQPHKSLKHPPCPCTKVSPTSPCILALDSTVPWSSAPLSLYRARWFAPFNTEYPLSLSKSSTSISACTVRMYPALQYMTFRQLTDLLLIVGVRHKNLFLLLLHVCVSPFSAQVSNGQNVIVGVRLSSCFTRVPGLAMSRYWLTKINSHDRGLMRLAE